MSLYPNWNDHKPMKETPHPFAAMANPTKKGICVKCGLGEDSPIHEGKDPWTRSPNAPRRAPHPDPRAVDGVLRSGNHGGRNTDSSWQRSDERSADAHPYPR